VNENFETNVPGIFIVGELSGVGMIKTAISEGKLVINHLQQRLEKRHAGAARPHAL
jgi:thioredoxin reductase